MSKFFKGKKTYIAAILLALQSILSLVAGDLTLMDFLYSAEFTQIIQAFGLMSVRKAIK